MTCSCGRFYIEKHVVSASNINRCIVCKGLVSKGFVDIQSINNSQYITDNGSCILNNGIIVLVDKDVSTYFEKKLIFYKKDECIF